MACITAGSLLGDKGTCKYGSGFSSSNLSSLLLILILHLQKTTQQVTIFKLQFYCFCVLGFLWGSTNRHRINCHWTHNQRNKAWFKCRTLNEANSQSLHTWNPSAINRWTRNSESVAAIPIRRTNKLWVGILRHCTWRGQGGLNCSKLDENVRIV